MPLRRHGDRRLCACVLYRVYSLSHQRARSGSFLPSSDQANISERAEPHIARAPIQPKSVDPRLSAMRSDLQVEAGAVVIHADLSERTNFCFSKLISEASHAENSPVGRTHSPHFPYASG